MNLLEEIKVDPVMYIGLPALTVALAFALATSGFQHKPFDFKGRVSETSTSAPSLKRDR